MVKNLVTRYLAALRAKMKIKNTLPPPDPGRNRPKIHEFLGEMAVRTLPRNPRGRGGGGGGGAKNQVQKHFKNSQG